MRGGETLTEAVHTPAPGKQRPQKRGETARAAHLVGVSHAKTLKSWRAWAQEGVVVQELSGDCPLSERETVMSFVEADTYGQITTATYRWMKRIESLGYSPETITTFERSAGQIRHYPYVSRQFFRMPSWGRSARRD